MGVLIVAPIRSSPSLKLRSTPLGAKGLVTRNRIVFSFSLESPTIIVQQRIDVAYDGGKPIWKKPAVIYASGPVASIGVIVTGIRKYTAIARKVVGKSARDNPERYCGWF